MNHETAVSHCRRKRVPCRPIEWYLRRGYALTGREEPFPLDDPRFGIPKTRALNFVVMTRAF
jgi:hypothetical protein